LILPFFVDTNILVYATGEDARREPCLSVLRAISSGGAEGRTSTAVVEEAWHLELSERASFLEGVAERAYRIFTPLLPVTDATVGRALDLDAPGLGANDRIHVATCLENGIDTIVTADAAFDGLHGIRRVDPLDRRALAALLTH
jgi:predicted nucleic acid-binding protein